MFIRQNDTGQIGIGPAVVIGDGYTVTTSLTLSGADSARARLGDDTTVDISGYTWAAITNMDGYYNLTLQTGITDTVGPLDILIEDVSLCLPIAMRFFIMDSVSYDALFAATPTLLTARDIGQLYESTIASGFSQTVLPCDVAIVTDDNWIGNTCTIEDVTNGETVTRWVTDVAQASDTITINAAPPFTIALGDKVRVESSVHPTYALNTYDPPTRTELTTDTNSILAKTLAYARIMSRKDSAVVTDQAVEIAEINADDGSGAGTFANTTDAIEAIRDQGDSAWITGAAGAITNGTADSGSTTTMVDAARTEADTDYWKGDWIHFTNGTLAGQVRLITGFTPGSDTITFTPATTQAVATHTYDILPGAAVDLRLWNGSAPTNLASGAVDATVSVLQTDVVDADSLAADAITEIWETALTEDYAADGVQGTAAQILYAIQQFLLDADISGTTMTVRRLDGTTAAYTLTLDNATTPTDKNRTS